MTPTVSSDMQHLSASGRIDLILSLWHCCKYKLAGCHPLQTAKQGLMCFTFGCHWESSGPSKVCGVYLCTSVAFSWHCTGKHHVWKYRMCQAMKMKIPIIHYNSSWQPMVEHSPNPSLHYDLLSELVLLMTSSEECHWCVIVFLACFQNVVKLARVWIQVKVASLISLF